MNTKWIIVTGASGGIGRNICELLSDMEYCVIMACRDMKKASPIFEDIKYITSNKNMRLMELDLSSFASIQTFANEIKERGYQIYSLVNNAGNLAHSYRLTQDGYEQDWGINYMGVYLLTRLILPLMKTDEGVCQIMNTVSVTAKIGRVDKNAFDSTTFSRFSNYGTSKLALMMFTESLAEKLHSDKNIQVNAYDPGVVNTNMINMHPLIDPVAALIFRPFLKSPLRAAQQEVNALLLDKKHGSGYVYKGKRHFKIRRWAAVHPFKEWLFQQSEKILKEKHGIVLEKV
ncbi:MAG: SDR family NAD(P)-dependent oxidoreductase [Flavobacteriales bacterium]|nr:SDR family NAD(P)-dependent oxidoreductase [Flavobacteriales bacterium]